MESGNESFEPASPEIIFLIKKGGLPIPYPAVARETEERSNHGFRSLKNRLEGIPLVPETTGDPALTDLLTVLNTPKSPFFSVGCGRWWKTTGDNNWWINGYIEFAFNEWELTQNAQTYFKLFFDFHYFVHDDRKSDLPVYFACELHGATFEPLQNAGGFVLGVVVTTLQSPDREQVFERWTGAISLLTDFLSAYKPDSRPGLTKIY